MKDFEAEDLEEQVLKEERERIRPLLRECQSLLSNCSHAEDQMERAVVLADLRKELGRQ